MTCGREPGNQRVAPDESADTTSVPFEAAAATDRASRVWCSALAVPRLKLTRRAPRCAAQSIARARTAALVATARSDPFLAGSPAPGACSRIAAERPAPSPTG